MGAAPALGARPVTERVVFSAGGEDYTWGDVVVAASLRGDWAAVAAGAERGLIALAALHDRGEGIAEDELDEAATAFRYERDLLSGDELEAWLEHWDLGTTDWTGWLGRALARDQAAALSPGAHLPDPDDVETAAGVEAICSGALESWGRELAERVAATLARGSWPGERADLEPPRARGVLAVAPENWRSSAARVSRFGAPPEQLVADTVDERAVERELAAHRLEWIAFSCRCLRLPEEAMAREALFCLRDDLCSLDDVAARARVEIEPLELILEEAEPEMQRALLGTREGELTGPLRHGEHHLLMVVDRKRDPDVGDPALAERARQHALRRTIRREVDTRVKWRERI